MTLGLRGCICVLLIWKFSERFLGSNEGEDPSVPRDQSCVCVFYQRPKTLSLEDGHGDGKNCSKLGLITVSKFLSLTSDQFTNF